MYKTFFLFVSCEKEEITNYYAYLKNATTHTIQIQFFSQGQAVNQNTLTLNQDATIRIANGYNRGINTGGGFSSKYFEGVDSIRVLFDNTYRVSHYLKTPVGLFPKHYLNTSTRNLGNKLSYKLEGKTLSKRKRENTYTYEFTEQDYLFAKQ